MKISVVAPCYNEQGVLDALHSRASAVCRQYGAYEIILVDDGSTDSTWRRISELHEQDERVVGIRLSRNHGHQVALTAALAHVTGDRILIMDADLQDPPELLPEMMRVMDEGADVVYGQRRRRAGVSRPRLATARIFYRVLHALSDVEIPEDTGDFRLISRRVADLVTAMPERHRYVRGMVSWVGFEQRAVVYDRQARFAGESHYSIRTLARLALDAITSFSIKPLRIASLLAFALSTAALFGLVFIIIGWWLKRPVQGWASLAVIILFLGAMQLFVLGIIGEYLGRLFIESKGRPLYTIAETTPSGSQTAKASVAASAS